ncbi:MAG: MFS transporter [Promethearchaeota archaeon]
MTKNKGEYTKDFKTMVHVALWNSLGFFFVEFIIIYVANQVLKVSGTQFGLVYSLLTIGGLLSSFIVGYLSDKYSKKLLVMIGSFGRGISYFSFYISIILQSLIGLYISSFLLGVGAGIFWVPFDALISEKSSKYHRSSAFAQRRFAMGIGMIIGGIFGFLIFTLSNIFYSNNPFLIYSAFLFFGFANFYAGIQFSIKVDENLKYSYQYDDSELNNSTENELKQVENVHPIKMVVFGISLLFLALFLSSINAGIAKPFIQPYILENIENNPNIVAWIYVPTSIIGTILAPKLGTLADKFNIYFSVILAGILGSFVTFLVITIKELWFFAILLILDNTIALFSGLVLMNFMSRISRKHRGKIFGSLNTFEQLGFSIGPIIGGIFWDAVSQVAPFIISIIVELALVPFFLLGIKLVSPTIEEVV